jgi:hypothetical protein
MKTIEKIFNFLFKAYFSLSLFTGLAYAVALFFLGKLLFATYNYPDPEIKSRVFEKLQESLFPNGATILSLFITMSGTIASIILACLLFRCFSKFINAKMKRQSLETQSMILSRAPKLLVGLYLVATLQTIATHYLPEGMATHDPYAGTSSPVASALKTFDGIMELCVPNLGSSLNIILALLIYNYVKNLRETDSLKREAELVV